MTATPRSKNDCLSSSGDEPSTITPHGGVRSLYPSLSLSQSLIIHSFRDSPHACPLPTLLNLKSLIRERFSARKDTDRTAAASTAPTKGLSLGVDDHGGMVREEIVPWTSREGRGGKEQIPPHVFSRNACSSPG